MNQPETGDIRPDITSVPWWQRMGGRLTPGKDRKPAHVGQAANTKAQRRRATKQARKSQRRNRLGR